jgi:uncharacterized protein YodC (DUF2158 family)
MSSKKDLEFVKGEVVRLKSGGPLMTILGKDRDKYLVTYFNSNTKTFTYSTMHPLTLMRMPVPK